jgi:uncharacterized membrane protein YhhN
VSAETDLCAVSAIAAVVYGLSLSRRPASTVRTVVKAAAVAALAVCAYIAGGPWPLSAALALSAIGDACLAGDPDRWLPPGMVAFLLAQLSYIGLFTHDGGGRAILLAEPVRIVGVVAAVAAVGGVLAWLWRGLGRMRGPVVLYAAALCAMASASVTLPGRMWPAMLGAAVFVAANGVHSAVLFRDARSRWVSVGAWFLYYAGQALITWAYLRQV